jgi:uncharacterized protein
VVFACQQRSSPEPLAAPSQAEPKYSGRCTTPITTWVLHSDTRVLPNRRLAWASWNYRLGGSTRQPAALTYNMNILQGLQSDTTFCVSLNQNEAIDPSTVLWPLPLRPPAIHLGRRRGAGTLGRTARGETQTTCGAYWANGFHEDGVVSGLRVAAAFGEQL